MREVDYQKPILIVRFSGEGFKENLDFVRSLKGANFVMSGRYWTVPVLPETIEILSKNNWPFTSTATALLLKKESTEISIDEDKLKGLFPYQIDGVKWLQKSNGLGIVGDEMGLGKTVQAIGYCKINPKKRPILVICPASIKLNWAREIATWSGEVDINVIYGSNPYPLHKSDWYIANYDILVKRGLKDDKGKIIIEGWVKEFEKVGIKVIIVDESQFISNEKAIRTKAVKYLRKHLKGCSFIGLSGTPIRNRPSEFFTILNMIAPEVFPNRWRFLNRYCAPRFNGFGWSFDGASNIEELHELIQPYMIRRLKSEVLSQLPPKIKSVVPLELEEVARKNYEDAEGEFQEWLDKNLHNLKAQQDQMEKLKQLAYLSKRNSMMQWIEDFLSSGEKLVIFAFHHMAIEDLVSKFKKNCVTIDGGTPQKERQAAIDKFQSDPSINLFIGQITAAGIGIDGLQNVCSNVAFAELVWTPSDHSQAEDRLHRMRKDGKYENQVTAHYLIAVGTIEDRIVKMLTSKSKNLGKILDGEEGKFFDKESTDLIKSVANQYRSKK